ncbi:LysR family transcriptional regulator [Arenibacterium sp. LLYu02]|uniref:LysR family transcriptional regulator n=1 Tax=Arenibacterium sp. LLYu02 TaxID=3404132 RepID=UPI003B20FF3A
MNLNSIDLNLLVGFEALMAERNVTRAAARVGRTQPAMSGTLARLRDLMEDELFVRSASGLQPTPRALELHEPISRALAQIQSAFSFLERFEPETADTAFTIAMSDPPTLFLLPALFEELAREAPGITLHVRGFDDRDEAIALLDSGVVDVAIGVPPTEKAGRILSRPLFEDGFVTIMRTGHPAARGALTRDTFLAWPHVLFSPEDDRFGIVDQRLEDLGLRRNLVLTVPNATAAALVVERTDAFCTMLIGLALQFAASGKVIFAETPLDLPRAPFTMNWHRRNDANLAQRWFRGLIGRVTLKRDRKHSV